MTYKNSTKKFWAANSSKFPNLTRLALVLLNISCSSAFIEQFFSICGIICKPRETYLKDDPIIMRSIMKANMELLNGLNLEADDEKKTYLIDNN